MKNSVPLQRIVVEMQCSFLADRTQARQHSVLPVVAVAPVFVVVVVFRACQSLVWPAGRHCPVLAVEEYCPLLWPWPTANAILTSDASISADCDAGSDS